MQSCCYFTEDSILQSFCWNCNHTYTIITTLVLFVLNHPVDLCRWSQFHRYVYHSIRRRNLGFWYYIFLFFLLFQNVENFDMCLCLALFNGPFPFNRKTNIWKESNRKRYRQFKKWMWIGFSIILCTVCMVMLQHNLKWYVGKYLFQTRSKSQNCNSKFILQTLHLHGHTTQISHNL